MTTTVRSEPTRWSLVRLVLTTAVAAGFMMASDAAATAAGFVSLYQFKGGADGAAPYGELVADSKGVLYGTTAFGGASHMGTVFSLTHVKGKIWQEKVIYSFKGEPNGANPYAGLIVDPETGELFGTTGSGGISNDDCSGCGTVFKLTPNANKTKWTETVLHKFTGGSQGAEPMAPLLLGAGEVLFGTTTSGGQKSMGTVFSLTPSGSKYTFKIVHDFKGGAEGGVPTAGLIADTVGGAMLGTAAHAGTLTGQCSQDSRGCGTVFRLTKNGKIWDYSTIYRFKSSKDGMEPTGPMVFIDGDLYGTTRLGGLKGQGSAFKLHPTSHAHTTWTEDLINSFKAGRDGRGPRGITATANGHLFGLTEAGGDVDPVFGGTLFELTPPASGTLWTEAVRHRFTGGTDGADPQGTLFLHGGVLYGLGNDGGDDSSSGSVFQYTP